MRGYLSFLLVLSILVCIFAFLQPFPALHSISDYRAIEAERMNSISMNIKEAIILSTSFSLRASALAYDALPEPEKNPVEREIAIRAGILAGWEALSLHQFSEDFEVALWCGHITSDTKEMLSREMIESSKTAILCPGCMPLSSPGCESFIQVSQKDPKDPLSTDKVRLASPAQIPGFFGVVGASIYSSKYNLSNVVYIPITEEIE